MYNSQDDDVEDMPEGGSGGLHDEITSKLQLTLLFDRPTEPIIMPRGDDASHVMEVPDSFLKPRVRQIKDKVKKRFEKPGRTTIPIKNISLPDLEFTKKIGMTETFTLFVPMHREVATQLLNVFMDARTVDDLISTAAYCHDRINPYLFNYSLSVAILHRQDTKDVQLPNFFQCFPGKFVDGQTFKQTREEVVMVPSAVREPIIIAREFTASSKEPEQSVAYFREDIGINLHHWHWHLVYPFGAADRSVVAKDRRGELFFYMHQQILARYNSERFANGLLRVKPYNNLREEIKEAYFPKLEVLIASRSWAPRFKNTLLSDVNRTDDELTFSIEQVETWCTNVREAALKGEIVDRLGKKIILDEFSGIDVLGDILESSMLTPNGELYGSIHNIGHVLISACHDPDHRYLEGLSLMSDTSTAMRDPIFYRWHCNVNDMFLLHKNSLQPYLEDNLNYSGIKITALNVTIDGKQDNQLNTFWQQSDVDLSRGIDFAPRSPILVRFTHLQNETFKYVIKVNNSTPKQLLGTVRIFMGPRLNDQGKAMDFNEQRHLMIELDRFKAVLKQGDNVITRSSLDSSVTIPYERTFRNVDAGRPGDDEPGAQAFNFCGCGWPQHMLVPKGTTAGMIFDLFAMVSNYRDDHIDQDIVGACNDADSYCGIQDRKYPDKRAMGYPFDRAGRPGVDTLAKFLTPNMKLQTVTVKFEDRVELRVKPAPISVVPANP